MHTCPPAHPHAHTCLHTQAVVDIGVVSAGIEGEATLIHGSVIALGSANLAVNAGEEQNELEIDSSAAIITDVLKPCEMRPCVPVCKTAIQNKFGQSHQASLCKADPACLKHNQECTESIKRQQKRAESTLNEAMRPHMPQPLGGGARFCCHCRTSSARFDGPDVLYCRVIPLIHTSPHTLPYAEVQDGSGAARHLRWPGLPNPRSLRLLQRRFLLALILVPLAKHNDGSK